MDLAFERCRIRVESNSNSLLEQLKRYYGQFVCNRVAPTMTIQALEMEPPNWPIPYTVKPPDPGKTKIKEEYIDLPDGRIIRKRLTGMVFLLGGETHIAAGPCEQNDNQVINFINNRYMEWKLRQDCLLFHAAGVALDGQGLALSGFAGAGKSTLALHLMSEGASFVSNDRLMVGRRGADLWMHGVPKLPRVNPGTILNNQDLITLLDKQDRDRFEDMSSDELWDLEHKYDVYVAQCFGPGRHAMAVPMRGLVVLDWRRDDSLMRIQQVDVRRREDLAPAYTKSLGLFLTKQTTPVGGLPDPHPYGQLLDGCPVYEVSGGVDFEAAAQSCLRLLLQGK
jgi:HprK-related kinase B